MQCDICSNTGVCTVVSAANFRTAVSVGFNPFSLECIPQFLLQSMESDFPARWIESATHGKMSESDWSVCPECMRVLEHYLPTFFVEGDCLLVHDGETLPQVCILTGQTENLVPLTRNHWWVPGWVYILLALWPIFLIVSGSMHKESRVTVYLHRSVMGRRKAWLIANWIIPFVVFFGFMLLLAPYLPGGAKCTNENNIGFIIIPICLAIITPIIIYNMKIKPYIVPNIERGLTWMKLRNPALIPAIYAAQFKQMRTPNAAAAKPDPGRTARKLSEILATLDVMRAEFDGEMLDNLDIEAYIGSDEFDENIYAQYGAYTVINACYSPVKFLVTSPDALESGIKMCKRSLALFSKYASTPAVMLLERAINIVENREDSNTTLPNRTAHDTSSSSNKIRETADKLPTQVTGNNRVGFNMTSGNGLIPREPAPAPVAKSVPALPAVCFTPVPVDSDALLAQFSENLPAMFARIAERGTDPIMVLVAYAQEKWRALLALLYQQPVHIYLSPETLTHEKGQRENNGVCDLYAPPTVNGQSLTIGIYALEREFLVTQLSSVKGLPQQFIELVKDEKKADHCTVVVLHTNGMCVRHLPCLRARTSDAVLTVPETITSDVVGKESDLDDSTAMESSDESLNSLLFQAIQTNYPDGVRRLIALGADVNERGDLGMTPLTAACLVGDDENVKLLVEHGADVNAADLDDITPLLIACHHDQLPLVRLLLDHGAVVTENHLLIASDYPEIDAYLRQHCATALHIPDADDTVASQFHSPLPNATPSQAAASIDDRLLHMLEAHLARVRTEQHAVTLEILDELAARFAENALAISEMVAQTLADQQLHTKAIGGGGIRTWLLVSAVPSDRANAVDFFRRLNPPGYFGYMNFWLNSEPLKMAREMGHDVFAHVLVYADAASSEPLSLGIGLVPLDPARQQNNPLLLIPDEALTREEKAALSQ